MARQRKGTFDDLNDALFAQMERLANASGDALEGEIERSRAVSQLAGNIISNANTAINLMRFQAMEGMDMAGAVATYPKMLVSGEKETVRVPTPQEVADPWIADNASRHTATYMADRLGWTFEEVVAACDRLGVSAKSADEVSKRSWREAEKESFGRKAGKR